MFFDGQAEEALAYYEKALGAKLEMLMRFSESPEPISNDRLPAGFENKIMHASFLLGEARVMVSDGGGLTGRKFSGFAISVQFPSEASVRAAFEALAEGGQIDMPIGPTLWSACFGMVTDRFGVQWMVTI